MIHPFAASKRSHLIRAGLYGLLVMAGAPLSGSRFRLGVPYDILERSHQIAVAAAIAGVVAFLFWLWLGPKAPPSARHTMVGAVVGGGAAASITLLFAGIFLVAARYEWAFGSHAHSLPEAKGIAAFVTLLSWHFPMYTPVASFERSWFAVVAISTLLFLALEGILWRLPSNSPPAAAILGRRRWLQRTGAAVCCFLLATAASMNLAQIERSEIRDGFGVASTQFIIWTRPIGRNLSPPEAPLGLGDVVQTDIKLAGVYRSFFWPKQSDQDNRRLLIALDSAAVADAVDPAIGVRPSEIFGFCDEYIGLIWIFALQPYGMTRDLSFGEREQQFEAWIKGDSEIPQWIIDSAPGPFARNCMLNDGWRHRLRTAFQWVRLPYNYSIGLPG